MRCSIPGPCLQLKAIWLIRLSLHLPILWKKRHSIVLLIKLAIHSLLGRNSPLTVLVDPLTQIALQHRVSDYIRLKIRIVWLTTPKSDNTLYYLWKRTQEVLSDTPRISPTSRPMSPDHSLNITFTNSTLALNKLTVLLSYSRVSTHCLMNQQCQSRV